ncbi:MAG: phosphatase PAP2 family protein [Muribaculaceae bacterium]|nr:phosphatase PAP2 family protein [Muribaculaceae bacterium]
MARITTHNRPSLLPSLREGAAMGISLAVWLGVTALCIGFRPEHVVMAVLLAALFIANPHTRRIVVALVPFALFGISYDWMNLLPNYKVNPVDIQGLYDLEKSLFGIAAADGGVLTPNEFFAIHHSSLADVFAGFFYLCWVPVPILFGLWLYFDGQRREYLHFAMVFLFVNLLGFALYYVHPAAPPWYVAAHGFDFIEGTPGEVAGLGRFDELTGLGIFNSLYARNANVFAAMPSLHSAYMLIAFIYSLRAKCPVWMRIVCGTICVGIWFTAVYSSHHYILDVLGGIGVTLAGYFIFEYLLMSIPAFSRFTDRYAAYISND